MHSDQQAPTTAKRIEQRARFIASAESAKKEEQNNKCTSLWRSRLAVELSVEGLERLYCNFTHDGAAECPLYYTQNILRMDPRGLNCIFEGDNFSRISAMVKREYGEDCKLTKYHPEPLGCDGLIVLRVEPAEERQEEVTWVNWNSLFGEKEE